MTADSITAKEIAQKILANEETFLLDIRDEEVYQDWAIQGEKVNSINVPFKHLQEEVENIKKQLPRNQTIYIICAKEISSQKAVELLRKEGVQHITYLKGGMETWSEHIEPVKIGNLPSGGELYQFIRIGKGCLSYMLLADGEAAVIDPVRMTEVYKNFAEEKDTTIKYVLDTHLHADHISGGKTLAEQTESDYYFPARDDEGLTYNYRRLEDGTSVQVGNSVDLSAFYSPGHTIGSTSFIIDNKYLMTGDILFIDSIGRPDLAGKANDWVDDLYHTLYLRYEDLPSDLIVLPAHFGEMKEINENGTVQENLATIYRKNDRLQVEDNEKFRHLVTDNLPPQPNSHEKIRKTNMGQLHPKKEERREMEVGPNRCAI